MYRLVLVLLLGLFSFFSTVDGLKCYACQPEVGGGRCRFGQEIKEMECKSGEDTCYSFTGNIRTSRIAVPRSQDAPTVTVVTTDTNDTRSCGFTSFLSGFTPNGSIKPGTCVRLVNAQDPVAFNNNVTYNGEMCLCKSDLCNTAYSANSGTTSKLSVFGIIAAGVLSIFRKI